MDDWKVKARNLMGVLIETVLVFTIVGIPIAMLLYYERKQLEFLEKLLKKGLV